MSDDQPGPPGANRDEVPGDGPTEPLTPPPSGPPTTPVPEPPAGTGAWPAPTWPQPEPPAQEAGPPAATAPYAGQPGYGQPGYGQPGYGPPPPGYGYGYPAGPPTDGTATAALVIAVVGFFVCAPVGAVVALVMANSAQRRIEASGGRLGGLELAKAARIIAIVELALTALLILGGVIAVAASLGARN